MFDEAVDAADLWLRYSRGLHSSVFYDYRISIADNRLKRNGKIRNNTIDNRSGLKHDFFLLLLLRFLNFFLLVLLVI
jgi:hypothetical protein